MVCLAYFGRLCFWLNDLVCASGAGWYLVARSFLPILDDFAGTLMVRLAYFVRLRFWLHDLENVSGGVLGVDGVEREFNGGDLV